MKKVVSAVGLAILSTASAQAQYDIGTVSGVLTPLETSKPWSVAASVRGFYDDNYLTLPKSYALPNGMSGHPLSSWGTEVSPSVALNNSWASGLSTENYLFDYQWYATHSTVDQTHEFNWNLNQGFGERNKFSLTESFAVAQEPTVLDTSIVSEPLRVPGNNIRNAGHIDDTISLTKLFDLHLGYGNNVYAYSQTARSVIGYPFTGAESGYTPIPSYSALLDRMEQLATIDLRWKATPETTLLAGYTFGDTAYTSPEYIIYPYGAGSAYPFPNGASMTGSSPGLRSNSRNAYSDTGFAGADISITPELNASIRLGAEYMDYYNVPDYAGGPTSRVSPYVDCNLTYQYLPGCSAQLGVKSLHNSTDVAGTAGDINGDSVPVLDEDSTAVYISDTHKLSDRLSVSLMGQAQTSTFVGGGPSYDGDSEQFYILQLNVAYHLNPWLMTEAGYNYSKLNSDLLDRAYTRDVVYIGFRAVY